MKNRAQPWEQSPTASTVRIYPHIATQSRWSCRTRQGIRFADPILSRSSGYFDSLPGLCRSMVHHVEHHCHAVSARSENLSRVPVAAILEPRQNSHESVAATVAGCGQAGRLPPMRVTQAYSAEPASVAQVQAMVVQAAMPCVGCPGVCRSVPR